MVSCFYSILSTAVEPEPESHHVAGVEAEFESALKRELEWKLLWVIEDPIYHNNRL